MLMNHPLNENLRRNTRDLYEVWVDFANITNGLRVQTTHRYIKKNCFKFFLDKLYIILYIRH